jgi:hypothetical protein
MAVIADSSPVSALIGISRHGRAIMATPENRRNTALSGRGEAARDRPKGEA